MPCASNFSDNDEKFWVSIAAPATEDQAGYEALTYTQVGGVKSRPEVGDNAADITESVLGEGRVCHRFGAKDGGFIELPVQVRAGDAGQALLLSNHGTNANLSFYLQLADGHKAYFTGVLGSMRRSEATTESIMGMVFQIAINSPELYV